MRLLELANMELAALRFTCARQTASAQHSPCAHVNTRIARAMAYGISCSDNGEDRFKIVCDKNGCDIQNLRFNGLDFKFYHPDGTDSGIINEVK